MPKYSVDVKAFISIEVEAANEYVENSLSPDQDEVKAWNDAQEEFGEDDTKIIKAGCLSVDGTSDVERIG